MAAGWLHSYSFVACVGTTPCDPRNLKAVDRGCPANTIGVVVAILLASSLYF